jgi:hypothetical protein
MICCTSQLCEVTIYSTTNYMAAPEELYPYLL